jgi:hypothetical protein
MPREAEAAQRTRYVVVVHEVEGTIAEDEFLGPFRDAQAAQRKAQSIERESKGLLLARVEVLWPGKTSARDVIALWGQRLVNAVERWAT